MVSKLVSVYFGSRQIGHPIKINCKKISDCQSRDLLEKSVGLVSLWFFKKNIYHIILY